LYRNPSIANGNRNRLNGSTQEVIRSAGYVKPSCCVWPTALLQVGKSDVPWAGYSAQSGLIMRIRIKNY